MRYLVIILLSLLVIGAGCFTQRPVEIPEPGQENQTEAVSGLVGVLMVLDEDTLTATLELVDGTQEEVVLPGDANVDVQDLGLLMEVSGTRDLATQIITVTEWTLISSPNLYVASPVRGATVTSPLLIEGFGRTFEQTFEWRIKETDGTIVSQGFSMTDAPELGVFGPFRLEIFLPAMHEKEFTLEVFETSAEDGSEINLVSVPLQLLTTNTSTFNVYYPDVDQGSVEDCERVFPVERVIAETSAIGRASIIALLAGPTEEEKQDGYFTSIPAGTELNSLGIVDEVARADFNAGLEQVAGSCLVTSIRSQITETLDQFSSVDEVIISVDGNSETALQP